MKKADYKKQVGAIGMNIKMAPRFSLTEKDLPEIKKWKVGENYSLCVEVKEVMAHETQDGFEATFEVQEAEVDDSPEEAD